MTNKEKLKAIVFYCWMRGGCDYTKEETERFYEDIEKGLEVLDVLKYRIHLKDSILDQTEVSFVEATGFVFKNSEEYKILKEWLENDTPRT